MSDEPRMTTGEEGGRQQLVDRCSTLELQNERLRHELEQMRSRTAELEALMASLPVAVLTAEDGTAERIHGNAAARAMCRLDDPEANVSATAPPDERPGYRTYRNGVEVPPEDLPMQRAARSGLPVSNDEVEMRWPDGKSVFTVGGARPVRDGEGRITGVVGVFMDITKLKALQREREAHWQQVEELFRQAPAVIAVYGAEHQLVFSNARYRELLRRIGLDPELDAATAWSRLGVTQANERLERVGASGEDMVSEEIHLEQPGGEEQHFSLIWKPLTLRDGSSGIITFAFDVTQQVQATRALQEAMSELRRSDERKNHFLAVLGHELRNPLAAVTNGLDLLELSKDEAAQRWAMEVLRANIAQLKVLVDDLLDVHRLERNAVRLKPSRGDLRDTIRHGLEAVRERIRRKRHDLRLELGDEPLVGQFDPLRVEQVVVNLLANACTYTPEGGRIEVTAQQISDQLEIRVRDNGAGLTPELLNKLFDAYVHDPRGDLGPDGLGIGLTVARQLVKLHGGTINATSEGPGRGAEFVVRLPIGAEVCSPEPVLAAAPRSTVRLGNHSVLVVDDNRDVAAVMAMALEQRGAAVDVCHDGRSALARCDDSRYDAVVLDIGLPDINGQEVARRLRAGAAPDAVLIALTGYGHPTESEQEPVFNRYLVKPIGATELVAELWEALGSSAGQANGENL